MGSLMESMRFLIRDVRVFDGVAHLPRASVLVEGGVIAAVGPSVVAPAGTDLIEPEADDATLLPGLIDCHTHAAPGTLAQAVVFGVTTELDMFCPPELVRRHRAEAASNAAVADVFSAGTGATAPGGHPTQVVSEVDWLEEFPTVGGPEQAADFVAERVAEGSQYLKIFVGGIAPDDGLPTLEPATVAALTEAAHTHGILAVAHALDQRAAATAVAAGVDALAHVFVDGPATPSFVAEVAQAGIVVTPTLTVLESLCGLPTGTDLAGDPRLNPYLRSAALAALRQTIGSTTPHAPQPDLRHARRSVQSLADAGVRILAGTDAGVPGTAHGASLHRELELLTQCGLTATQALAAATAVPAACFGLSDRGRVAPGRQADLVLVRGDPTTEITHTRNILAVWRRGQRIDRGGNPGGNPGGDRV
jgi:imidazolonepropionase-like amidohydrolase